MNDALTQLNTDIANGASPEQLQEDEDVYNAVSQDYANAQNDAAIADQDAADAQTDADSGNTAGAQQAAEDAFVQQLAADGAANQAQTDDDDNGSDPDPDPDPDDPC